MANSFINSSIYIPRMSVDHSEEYIRYIMNYYKIGRVSYVDFTPINKKPGFNENVSQVFVSAFVHFSDPWLLSNGQYSYHTQNEFNNIDFWNLIANGQSYKIQLSNDEYWLCLENKNPVQRTMMNIHQIVENGRHLEAIIEAQSNKIKQLEESMEHMNLVLSGLVKDREYFVDLRECCDL